MSAAKLLGFYLEGVLTNIDKDKVIAFVSFKLSNIY